MIDYQIPMEHHIVIGEDATSFMIASDAVWSMKEGGELNADLIVHPTEVVLLWINVQVN